MLSLTPVIEALKHKPAVFPHIWFKKIEGAANYAQVDIDRIPTPTAWVIRGAEAARPDGERASYGTNSFDVVIVISNAKTHKINEIDDQLLDYRNAVRGVLQGFETAEMSKPVAYLGGKPLRYSAGVMFWADRYSYEALTTNYLPDPVPFTVANFAGDKIS